MRATSLRSTATRCKLIAIMLLVASSLAQGQEYPASIQTIKYRTQADDTRQPALWWSPAGDKPVPLLVALHTWSSDYKQAGGEAQYALWCQQAGWAFIHPNFRGTNTTPDAMGSELAVKDIISAVDFAKQKTNIDPRRIYCVGVSGGGHASLLMAARAPDVWAGVSAWCGISDIAAWHQQCRDSKFERYADHIEGVLHGSPQNSSQRRQQAMRRSPIYWLARADKLPPLDINHGIHDGRTGSVPFTHSLRAWNKCVDDAVTLSQESIRRFYESQKPPASSNAKSLTDELYGKRQPLFRRTYKSTRITVFDGGHEIIHDAALNWLAAQVKDRPVDWSPKRLLSVGGGQDSGQ